MNILIKRTLLFLATLLIFDLSFSQADEWKVVNLNNCNFQVEFPGNPKIEKLSAPSPSGKIEWERAQLIKSDGMFRHECICPPNGLGIIPNEDYVRDRLSLAATAYGLSNIYFTTLNFPSGTAMEMRGWKIIKDRSVTYVIRAYVTSECYADLVTASEASKYPTKGMTRFNKSLKFVDHKLKR